MRIVPWVVGSCLVGLTGVKPAHAQPAPPTTAPPGTVNGPAVDPAAQPTGSPPAPSPAAPPPAAPPPTPTGPEPREPGPLVPPAQPVAPAPSPAAPKPTALEKAAGVIGALIRPYGTLKPTVIMSVGTLESFGNPNASAETAAGNPMLATLPKDTRATFQVAQSRMGIYIAESSKARGQVEIDFVDFTKSSPTLASLPRLRIAKVEWEPIERLVLAMGQDWDLHSPVNGFGTNMVGGTFLAGNTGFMRQQIKAIYTFDKVAEVGTAVGFQSANNGFKDASQELARVPTFAVRAALIMGKSRIGVSGIATQLRQAPGTADERRTGSYSGLIYADLMPIKALQIKAEGYIARNLSNIGALALGFGTAKVDIDEVGGFVSTKGQLHEKHAIYGTLGAAQVLNKGDVVPGYSVTPAATPTGTATRALSGTGPGLQFNFTARVGYEYRPVKPLALVAEVFVYRSRHVFQAADAGTFDPMRNAPGAEVGAMYTF